MRVYVIHEDLSILCGLSSHVHPSGFLDRESATAYAKGCAESAIAGTQNPDLTIEVLDHAYAHQVDIRNNNDTWLGMFEIRAVEVG